MGDKVNSSHVTETDGRDRPAAVNSLTCGAEFKNTAILHKNKHNPSQSCSAVVMGHYTTI